LLLETCLKDHPELVSVDAERITKRATSNPDAYLAKTATETPESLLETFRASLETDTNPAATDWPESLVNELRLAALDLADNPAELQEQYNEYLLSSGSIPADLVDIAQARGMGYLSLEHLVADCRTIALGLEFYGLDPDTLAVGIGDFEKPVAGDFGSNQERYQEALELYQKRVEYRKAFESRQADLVEEWLKVHADPSLASALESEQVEALEAERIANPELSADPEHYSRLIHSELVDLPGVETLADYLNNPDTHESFIVPQLQAEFAEFWNAYPARPEGKGRKIAALRAWCEARKTTSQEALMSELRGAFLGVEPRLIPWPSSWLSNLTRPAQDAHLATGDQF
jgi:tetratricopeptide (TPR) repeat protein